MKYWRASVLIFVFLPIVTGCPSLKSLFQTQKESMRTQIQSHCSQHLINWYVLEKNSMGVITYKFGKNDRKFRKEIEGILNKYVETGEDITVPQKIRMARRFTPNYLKTCQAFYGPAIDECTSFDRDDPRFGTCLDEYDTAYKGLLEVYFAKALIEGTRDIDQFDIGKARKELRKMQIDPLSILKP